MIDPCIYYVRDRFYNLNPLGQLFTYTKANYSTNEAIYMSFCHNLPPEAFTEANCKLNMETSAFFKKADGSCIALAKSAKNTQANYVLNLERAQADDAGNDY